MEIPEERIRATLALMGRRGPDADGIYCSTHGSDRNICLLHSRLSIIDLDPRANQPFRCRPLVAVYNGEVYNYLEIKADLEKEGVAFDTTGDTEVLVKAIRAWGTEALGRCEGMWAWAMYDEDTGRLTLSRDRFGEKPLYYYRDDRGLYFASEPKMIVALLGRRLDIHFRHLYRYLVGGYRFLYKTGEGFFKDLKELPPGTVMTVDPDGRERVERYWHPRLDAEKDMTFDECVTGVRDRLVRSVALRLRSDVPLAFCMSGGVDSNSLIAIARRVLDYDVHGFTIVNTDERYAEQDMVDLSVKELGIKHTDIPLTTHGFIKNLPKLIEYHDAPIYTITYYVHWLLMCQVRREGYKISISGAGADELFSGYYDHQGMYLADAASRPTLFEEALEDWKRHVGPAVRNPHLQNPLAFVENPGLRAHLFPDRDRFGDCLKHPFEEPFTEIPYHSSLLRNRMLNEMFHESVPVILHEDDLNAMYFSVENRSPFLDRELFEFSLKIPTRFLIRQAYAKAVLRQAMRGIVPDPILDERKKIGFNAPILSLLDPENPLIRQCLLDDGPIFDHVDRRAVAAMLEKKSMTNSESQFLFNFLCARFFLDIFDR